MTLFYHCFSSLVDTNINIVLPTNALSKSNSMVFILLFFSRFFSCLISFIIFIIGVFLSNGLRFEQRPPVISRVFLSQRDLQPGTFMTECASLRQNAALEARYCELPILTIPILNFNCERAIGCEFYPNFVNRVILESCQIWQ